MSDYIRHHSIATNYKIGESWVILNEIEQSIKTKIELNGTPLKNWDIKINRGILTGLNDAFIIDKNTRDILVESDPKSAEIIRPIIRGRDIKQNKIDFKDLYIINVHNGYISEDGTNVPPVNVEQYPAIKNWFDNGPWNKKISQGSNYERLAKRTDKGFTPYNLRSLAYMEDFSKQKIVFPAIMSQGSYFALETNQMIVVAPGNMLITNKNTAICDFLTSNICYFALKKFYMGGGIEGELKVNRLLQLPIPTNLTNKNYTNIQIAELYGLNKIEMEYINTFFD